MKDKLKYVAMDLLVWTLCPLGALVTFNESNFMFWVFVVLALSIPLTFPTRWKTL